MKTSDKLERARTILAECRDLDPSETAGQKIKSRIKETLELIDYWQDREHLTNRDEVSAKGCSDAADLLIRQLIEARNELQ